MPRVPENASPPAQRALIVKFGSIGDVIMAVPGAALLHGAGYAIDWVVSESVAPLLRLYPWIHVIEVKEADLLRESWPVRLQTSARLWRKLRQRTAAAGAYDLVATLYYDRRYDLLSAGVPARRRVRLSRTDRRLALLAGRHHTDEYARILTSAVDAERPNQLSPVPLSELPIPALAPPAARRRIVLVPAGARNVLRDDALRRWPIDNYVTLAARLLSEGFEVVLAGGPEDRWASAYFTAKMPAPTGNTPLDLMGKLTLVETVSLLQTAMVTVVHDTGPLHLAGITGTSIVSLFGPTDPHGRLPRRDNSVALWGGEGFACRPCYDGRDYAPCPHNGCLHQVSAEQVFVEVLKLVQLREQGGTVPPTILTPPPTPFVTPLVQIGTSAR